MPNKKKLPDPPISFGNYPPADDGRLNVVFKQEGRRISASVPEGSGGDVSGPVSSTDNAIARWNGTTGDTLQNSTPTVQDDGRIASVTDPTNAQDAATKAYVDANSGGGTGALAIATYAAGSDSTLHTQSSNTMTDMDATNVKVTFTAPSSGKVLVVCSILHQSSTAGDTYWGLRESTTTIATQYILGQTSEANAWRAYASFYITGLTPGNSYTYKLAHRLTSGSVSCYTGPNYGPAVMEVWSMP